MAKEEKEEEKARYTAPASQDDLERRLERGNASTRALSTEPDEEGFSKDVVEREPVEGRDMRVEEQNTDGFIGVSPEYQNYANEAEAPLTGEGAEGEVEERFLEGDPQKAEKKSDESDESEDFGKSEKSEGSKAPTAKKATASQQSSGPKS